jgi:putative nucleotidyltransferase with HDIG domain
MGVTAESRDITDLERPWALNDLPPYRPVARKLMTLTAQADVPLEQVQQVLRTDAAFTADVLRLANSSLIGMRSEIKSVMQAVMMLGLERVKALATTLALRTFLTCGVHNDILHGCWRHNLATAILCEWLARLLHMDGDTCYTAGLLHDIGRLALLRAHPQKYELILEMEPRDGSDLRPCEKSIFEIDHCQAGKWILSYWGFPKDLLEVVSLHHDKPGAGGSMLLRTVYAGWQMADLLGFSALNRPVAYKIEEIVSVIPGKAPQQVLAEFGGQAENVALKINAIECSLL